MDENQLMLQLNELKEKRELNDIDICYSNLETLNNIIKQLKQSYDKAIIEKRDELIRKIYIVHIYKNIRIIIDNSYKEFKNRLNKDDKDNNFKQLLLKIQQSYQVIATKELLILFLLPD